MEVGGREGKRIPLYRVERAQQREGERRVRRGEQLHRQMGNRDEKTVEGTARIEVVRVRGRGDELTACPTNVPLHLNK